MEKDMELMIHLVIFSRVILNLVISRIMKGRKQRSADREQKNMKECKERQKKTQSKL